MLQTDISGKDFLWVSLTLAAGIAVQSAEIISALLLQLACKGGFGVPRAHILCSQVMNLSKTSPPAFFGKPL